jgi:nicotinate-nucleotide--dimethylbenzimidazole phosphoribosyltransferase
MIKTIEGINRRTKACGTAARERIDQLTKPLNSLGRLEELAIELAEMTGDPLPTVTPPGVIVFAADHGVAKEGVSAYPPEVTAQMVFNFLRGGAAINVFSRQIGALMRVVDVGVAFSFPEDVVANADGMFVDAKVRFGTRNMLAEEAMTRDETITAIEAGISQAHELIDAGAKIVIPGEMGIGNTTAASALLAALSGKEVTACVGAGTGVAGERLLHKIAVVQKALQERSPNAADPIDVLGKVGGLEIAAMAGAILGAAQRRTPVLLDGFISTVAALIAVRLAPACRDYLLAGHRSQETGHALALSELGLAPLIDLKMRLGEGSGAALAFPIVDAACRMVREMATFAEAGVASGGGER